MNRKECRTPCKGVHVCTVLPLSQREAYEYGWLGPSEPDKRINGSSLIGNSPKSLFDTKVFAGGETSYEI